MFEPKKPSDDPEANPYAFHANKLTGRSTLPDLEDTSLIPFDFPFWLMGPIPWAATPYVAHGFLVVLRLWRGDQPPPNDVGVVFMLPAAAVFGVLYAFVLALVCRRFRFKPHAGIHFCVVAAAFPLASAIMLVLPAQFFGMGTFFLLMPGIGFLAAILSGLPKRTKKSQSLV